MGSVVWRFYGYGDATNRSDFFEYDLPGREIEMFESEGVKYSKSLEKLNSVPQLFQK